MSCDVSYCAHSSHATDSNTPEGTILLAGSLCSLIPFAGMAAIGSKVALNMLGCMSEHNTVAWEDKPGKQQSAAHQKEGI